MRKAVGENYRLIILDRKYLNLLKFSQLPFKKL